MRFFRTAVGKARDAGKREDPFLAFTYPGAVSLNLARLQHLSSLNLELGGKRVLEVGAGIGLLTSFFLDLGCETLSTDARPENVAEIRRRFPNREVAVLDLEEPGDLQRFGSFDVVFCYGTLYHLAKPGAALKELARVCELILLETCVTPGAEEAVNLVPESAAVNQAFSRFGSRPTRPWVMQNLRENWSHAYITRTQPDHPEFPLNWATLGSDSELERNTRAVFVGSKLPLDNDLLATGVLDLQTPIGVTGERGEPTSS
ncbi:MAG TPA: class I SAM-dependent methyltransferase [Candidatus Solibacter sp.]|jgi:SAM-dependent methyltransferase|nr:class I SAM-dependent methyltransferase [Candidatus Solibacter sp.]